MAVAALLLAALLALCSARAPAVPFAHTTDRARLQLKTVLRRDVLRVRVGGARLAGALGDAAGVAVGGALLFAGASVAEGARARVRASPLAAAAARLAPWLLIGGVSARASHCAMLACVGASPLPLLPLVAALAACAGARRLLMLLPQVNASTLALSLGGGVLLVESLLSQLLNEFDHLALRCTPLLLHWPLRPLIAALRRLRRTLLPLPLLAHHPSPHRPTAFDAALSAAEAAYDGGGLLLHLAALCAVGAMTQPPVLCGAARHALDSAVAARARAPLPPPLRTGEAERRPDAAVLAHGAPFLAPYLLAVLSCLAQGGYLSFVGDAPRVLLRIISCEWGAAMPLPSLCAVVRKVRQLHRKHFFVPATAGVKTTARRRGEGIAGSFERQRGNETRTHQ
ncbi:hypothetical protein AB1Y20_005304 [Prymnesium parvum]|uniref:Uncharacterized protein n=1 Tax=Prymnesium parvum TaxID=97485 RepID=A0AB34J3Y1_PRYPA